MIDDAAKANLYDYLKHEREAVLAKLDGLSEYDVRRPLTVTGTNLLGLVKHLATREARYLGEGFDRPFPEPLPRWDVEAERLGDMWAAERESRSDIIDRYRRVWEHSDATVDTLTLDATGQVAWWQDAEVPLFNVLVHCLPRPVDTPAMPTSPRNRREVGTACASRSCVVAFPDRALAAGRSRLLGRPGWQQPRARSWPPNDQFPRGYDAGDHERPNGRRWGADDSGARRAAGVGETARPAPLRHP